MPFMAHGQFDEYAVSSVAIELFSRIAIFLSMTVNITE